MTKRLTSGKSGKHGGKDVTRFFPRARARWILPLALMFGLINPASAAEPGWFAGFGFGAGDYSDDELQGVCGDLGLDCRSDTEDTAYKFLGGYQFSRYFAVEGGLLDWGEVSVTTLGDAGLRFEGKGPYLSLLPELPIGDTFSLFGELGVIYVDAKLAVTLPVIGRVGSISDSTPAPIYGFGGALNFNSFTVRLQWQRLDPHMNFTVNGIPVSSPKFDLASASLIFRF